jgi:hypothetical protein
MGAGRWKKDRGKTLPGHITRLALVLGMIQKPQRARKRSERPAAGPFGKQ